jgi:hypothetical protein
MAGGDKNAQKRVSGAPITAPLGYVGYSVPACTQYSTTRRSYIRGARARTRLVPHIQTSSHKREVVYNDNLLSEHLRPHPLRDVRPLPLLHRTGRLFYLRQPGSRFNCCTVKEFRLHLESLMLWPISFNLYRFNLAPKRAWPMQIYYVVTCKEGKRSGE